MSAAPRRPNLRDVSHPQLKAGDATPRNCTLSRERAPRDRRDRRQIPSRPAWPRQADRPVGRNAPLVMKPAARAETLTLEESAALFRALRDNRNGS